MSKHLYLSSCKNQLSNLEKAVDKCMRIALDLPSMWRNSTYIRKQRIQNLLFPEGINYSRKNDDYRTMKINLLFSVIPYLTGLAAGKKMGISIFQLKSPLGWSHLESNQAPTDYESVALTE